jgi:hypothetical protein
MAALGDGDEKAPVVDMSRPRPVTLTEGELRALRVMEEALTAEDPALSSLLGRPTRARRAGRRVWWLLSAWVVLSVLLFLLGVGASDPRLQGISVLMLLSGPVAMLCRAELKRRWP